MDTEDGGEASRTSTECQSRCKRGQMINIHLTVSDEEAIVDFVKNHEELYDKTHKKFKDKDGKDCRRGCKQPQPVSEGLQGLV